MIYGNYSKRFGESDGFPDGMCMDRKGKIFLAMWGGASLLVIDSKTGCVEERISMPVSQPSSCCLNEDETELYITTAWQGLTDAQRDLEPEAGSIYALKLK